ncbi:MAG: Arm DNA-binding domain-containing protein, partial [Hyphomonas sp.]|nr:Arm DNA-binding domain-containing protein [Hyphomonas sp.]
MSKLTKRIVDASGSKDAEYFVWDRELKGFGLRVYPSGRKTFVLQYRSGGRTRRLNVGPYGPLTVEEARDLARQNRGDVAKGGDPSAQRAKERRVPTVTELCDKFLKEHVTCLMFFGPVLAWDATIWKGGYHAEGPFYGRRDGGDPAGS